MVFNREWQSSEEENTRMAKTRSYNDSIWRKSDWNTVTRPVKKEITRLVEETYKQR